MANNGLSTVHATPLPPTTPADFKGSLALPPCAWPKSLDDFSSPRGTLHAQQRYAATG